MSSLWLTAKECVDLPGMPSREHNVRNRLDKVVADNTELRRRRKGSKAFEYDIDCLPIEAREAVLTRYYNSVLASTSIKPKPAAIRTCTAKAKNELQLIRQCPSLLAHQTGELTDDQRSIADSRCALVAEVLRLETEGLSRIKAIAFICDQSRAQSLPEALQQHAERANARRGKRVGVSVRTLNSWVVDYCRAQDSAERLILLAPGHHKATKPESIEWLPHFLSHWRNLNGPTIREAYNDFCDEWARLYANQPAMLTSCPSYDSVRRAVNKLTKKEKYRGRVSGSAARALDVYQKRDWSQMRVNDVWIGDGHGAKLQIAHPIHGQPFKPEITMIMDGVTRYVVGWSVSLSESTLAVSDALRHGIQHNGIPLIYYSDNGGGQKNHTLDAEITGILPRLSIRHETGIPGNPQGRGIIERAHQTVLHRLAKHFPTYYGKSADRDSTRVTLRAINSAVNAQNQGKELTAAQQRARAKLPSWEQFLDEVREGINWYNTRHQHSELPKDENGKHYTPAAYRALLIQEQTEELCYLSEIELNHMFMPQIIRKAQQGWLTIFNNDYFSYDLLQADGEDVIIGYDIHNAEHVQVYNMDGSFLCKAIWNGNKKAPFAKPVVEQQREKRAAGMEKRAQRRIDEARAELRPALEANTTASFDNYLMPDIPAEEKEYFFLEVDRDAHIKKNGTHNK
ncbi:transposase [Budviciaceae bacterium CWB-B4]|uniref:Transposase n=1 Tax=Limnobaculum xujianqingii TaxID=2738837 RepID=A0A9D7FS61_9GAMM|nr:Mu transposase C-terminal domain-containing protein [Limnobaculum xujianqingii]MBK5072538.1 transposase [Limnobaculum xujianqingii]MBK5175847.1 transposase [Limnobaculum xujianqingii]